MAPDDSGIDQTWEQQQTRRDTHARAIATAKGGQVSGGSTTYADGQIEVNLAWFWGSGSTEVNLNLELAEKTHAILGQLLKTAHQRLAHGGAKPK